MWRGQYRFVAISGDWAQGTRRGFCFVSDDTMYVQAQGMPMRRPGTWREQPLNLCACEIDGQVTMAPSATCRLHQGTWPSAMPVIAAYNTTATPWRERGGCPVCCCCCACKCSACVLLVPTRMDEERIPFRPSGSNLPMIQIRQDAHLGTGGQRGLTHKCPSESRCRPVVCRCRGMERVRITALPLLHRCTRSSHAHTTQPGDVVARRVLVPLTSRAGPRGDFCSLVSMVLDCWHLFLAYVHHHQRPPTCLRRLLCPRGGRRGRRDRGGSRRDTRPRRVESSPDR